MHCFSSFSTAAKTPWMPLVVPVLFFLLVSQVVPHLAQHAAHVREGHVRVRLRHLRPVLAREDGERRHLAGPLRDAAQPHAAPAAAAATAAPTSSAPAGGKCRVAAPASKERKKGSH